MRLKWVYFSAAALCLTAQLVTARNIFLLPADGSTSGITTITSEFFQAGPSVASVAGAFRVLAAGNGTKYYVLSNSADAPVTVLNGTFPSLAQGRSLSVGGQVTDGAVSPDGRRLVLVGPSGVAIIDTAADTIVRAMGNIDVGGAASDVAVSVDSARAFVLSASTGKLTAIDLNAGTIAGAVIVAARPAAVSVAPNGLLYVSAQNVIYEYDPTTLAGRAAIQVNGSPGKLRFSPDGTLAFALNSSAIASRPFVAVNLATRAAVDLAPANFVFTDLAVTGNGRGYAITQQGALYQIATDTQGAITYSAVQSVTNGALPAQITRIAATGEGPNSRNLVIATANGVYQLNLAANSLTDPISSTGQTIAVVQVPQAGAATSATAFNATQTVAAGRTSLPLVVRAYNANGIPVTGVPVTFSTTATGVSIANSTTTTNAQGYAFVTVTVPESMSSGSIPVTAAVQGAPNAQFTITVGTPNVPGIGGGTATDPFRRTGLYIVSGQGQAVANFFPAEPLVVKLTDAQGNPISNATITWKISRGTGSVSSQQTTTDGSGQTSVNFTGFALINNPGTIFGNAPEPSVITATGPSGQSVDFYATTVAQSFNINPLQVDYTSTNRTITLKAGEVLPNAIQAVTSSNSTGLTGKVPLQNIAMYIINSNTDPSAAPYVQCRDVFALSDIQGLVSCDLVAGPRPGETTVTVAVGATREQFTVKVEQAAPGSIRILQGNNQTGSQSQVLGQSLVIEVVDATGSPLPNVPVSWDTQLGTFTSQQNTTDFSGRAQATYRAPSDRTGPVTITARAGNSQTTFTVTVVPSVAAGAITIQSGNNQNAAIGQAFGQGLSVQLKDAQGQGISGAMVDFRVTSGNATVNPASAQTNAQGVATANVTAGATAGPVVVTASVGNLTTAFNLTVRPPGPSVSASDILTAAGFQVGVSPGSIAYIRVRGIAPNLRGSTTANTVVGPLPLKLADVEVLFNNIPAPIYAVSNVNGEESVVVQVPFEVNPGSATVTIRSATGGSTTVENVQISAFKPGVFTFTDVSGLNFAVATRPDGTFVTSANPARRGEEIRIYVTGVGQTASATGTNRAGVAGQMVVAPVIAGLNNAGVRVRSAQLMEGTIGVYVVTMEVPADTTTGPNQPLGFAVQGADGQFIFANGSAIPII